MTQNPRPRALEVLDAASRAKLSEAVAKGSARAVARAFRVESRTITRAIAGEGLTPATAGYLRACLATPT